MKNRNIGWQRVLLLVIPFFLIVGFFQFIGALLSGIDYSILHSDISSKQWLIISIFNFIGTFVLLWLFMKYVDKEKFINLGFNTMKRFKDFIVGLGVGFFVMLIGFLFLFFLNEINFQKTTLNLREITISIIGYSIVVIAEEALFRGYVLRNFLVSFNNNIALILSSILFALAHIVNPNINLIGFINLFLAGILLGVSYSYTKNLWFPIALHFSWNLFQTFFGFNVSGKDAYSIIDFS